MSRGGLMLRCAASVTSCRTFRSGERSDTVNGRQGSGRWEKGDRAERFEGFDGFDRFDGCAFYRFDGFDRFDGCAFYRLATGSMVRAIACGGALNAASHPVQEPIEPWNPRTRTLRTVEPPNPSEPYSTVITATGSVANNWPANIHDWLSVTTGVISAPVSKWRNVRPVSSGGSRMREVFQRSRPIGNGCG